MDISIIIPTYNSEKSIFNCVCSITKQKTHHEYEIIIIDDGSIDNTLDICFQLEKKYSSIKIFSYNHRGVASARNMGLLHSNGKYIMFVDSDDELRDFALDELGDAIDTYKADVVECAYEQNGRVRHLWTNIPTVIQKGEHYRLSGFLWNKIYKKSVFDRIEFYNGHYYEDMITHMLIYPLAKKIIYLPRIVYNYNRHTQCLSERLTRFNEVYDSIRTFEHYIKEREKHTITCNEDLYVFFMTHAFKVVPGRARKLNKIQRKKLLNKLKEVYINKLKKYENAFSKAYKFSSLIKILFDCDIDLWLKQVNEFDIESCMKKKIPNIREYNKTIVFAADNEYIPQACVALKSIIENNTSNCKYDCILVTNEISDEIRSLFVMSFIGDDLNIRFFNIRCWIENLNVNIPNPNLSEVTYYRLFIPFVLCDDYRTVLYLDGDMVAIVDIAELFELNVSDYFLASTQDITGIAEYYSPNNRKKAYRDSVFKGYDLDNYFVAALLLFNLDKFRNEYTIERITSIVQQGNWEQNDQDVLNYICKGQVYVIDSSWDVIADYGNNKYLPVRIKRAADAAEKNPKIVHYGGGSRKPWKKRGIKYEDFFWDVASKTSFYQFFSKLLEKNQEGENERKRLLY